MRFKNLLVVLIIGLGLTHALATETRVGSLGGTGFFIRDETNIFYFPATINQYPGLVIGELRAKGLDDSYSFGIHLPHTNGTFGIYLNVPTYINPPDFASWGHVQMARKMMLFYGRRLNTLNVGFHLSYLYDKFDGGDDGGKEYSLYLSLGAGISSERFDIGLRAEFPRMRREYDRYNTTWSGFGIGLFGRYFQEINPKLTFIPAIHIFFEPTSISNESDQSLDINTFKLGFGMGTKYQLNENNFVIIGTEILGYDRLFFSSESFDSTKTSIVFPGIYAGIESSIKPWLQVRLGAIQVFKRESQSLEYNSQSFEETAYYSGFKMTFGLGILLGNFRLDATFNESLLFEGPNILNGTNVPLANKISLTYLF
ncbi:hypothetical protein ACX8XN_01925 [Calditrichota bacterium GD2]